MAHCGSVTLSDHRAVEAECDGRNRGLVYRRFDVDER